MSNKHKELVEAALNKKPLDVRSIVEDLMQEKARAVLSESVNDFEYGDDLTEEEELELFFQEFHEEYGHLSEDEQKEIMEELLAETDEATEGEETELTEAEEAFFKEFQEAFGDLDEDEQDAIMEEIFAEVEEELNEGDYEADQNVDAFISKASAKIQTKFASGKKGEGDPMKVAPKKQPRNHIPDVK